MISLLIEKIEKKTLDAFFLINKNSKTCFVNSIYERKRWFKTQRIKSNAPNGNSI